MVLQYCTDNGLNVKTPSRPYVTVSRKRMSSAQNLECKFYISAGSVKRTL